MKCTIKIPASTAQEAEAKASGAFQKFFGTEEFKITSKESESSVVLVTGEVIAYECTFSAVLTGQVGYA